MANRHNSGKPELVYLLDFPHAIKEVAEVAAFGANKYGRHNWKKGLQIRDVTSSLLRHLTAFLNGEDTDEESGLSHTGAIAWNAFVLSEMYRQHYMDDRDKS